MVILYSNMRNIRNHMTMAACHVYQRMRRSEVHPWVQLPHATCSTVAYSMQNMYNNVVHG